MGGGKFAPLQKKRKLLSHDVVARQGVGLMLQWIHVCLILTLNMHTCLVLLFVTECPVLSYSRDASRDENNT